MNVFILRRAMDDDRLSWKARGILRYLVANRSGDGSLPTVRAVMLSGAEGADAVRSAFKELTDRGYLVLGRQRRNDQGRAVGGASCYSLASPAASARSGQ